MTDDKSASENTSQRPNIEFAPGCFGSTIDNDKSHSMCQKCAFISECDETRIKTAIVLQSIDAASKLPIMAPGPYDHLIKIAKAMQRKVETTRLNRNEKDRDTYEKEQKQAGRTVRPYNDRSSMTPADLKALEDAENRKNVKAYRDRKKAEKAAASAAKSAPS